MASRSFIQPLEAHSQAKAGEELSLGGIEVLELVLRVLVPPTLVSDLTGKPQPDRFNPAFTKLRTRELFSATGTAGCTTDVIGSRN